jgi:hypothetical protein
LSSSFQTAGLEHVEFGGGFEERARDAGFVTAEGFESAGSGAIGSPGVALSGYCRASRVIAGEPIGFHHSVVVQEIVFHGGGAVEPPVAVDDLLRELFFTDADRAEVFDKAEREIEIRNGFVGLQAKVLTG